MKKQTYYTNLASEYYILSCLFRQEIEAQLTLGNKKSVDIIIETDSNYKTIDVKGLIGKSTFRLYNVVHKENHYVIFISFLDRFNDTYALPEIYIVPSLEIPLLIQQQTNQDSLYLSTLRKNDRFLNNWKSLKE